MALPEPVPGLVIGYAYLWRHEKLRGQEEGLKNRPCVIVLAVESTEGQTVVTVAPITHTPPVHEGIAIELPAETKRRLGLDQERSWIIAADLNRFIWPGVDLRPVQVGARSYAYGMLPANLYRHLRDIVLALASKGRVCFTSRNE
jgi:hypothetical protein